MSVSVNSGEIKFVRVLLVIAGSSLLFLLALAVTLLLLGTLTAPLAAALLAACGVVLLLGAGVFAFWYRRYNWYRRYHRLDAARTQRRLDTDLAALDGEIRQAERDLQQAIRSHSESRRAGIGQTREAARARLQGLLAQRAALQAELDASTPPTPRELLSAAVNPGRAGCLGAVLLLLVSSVCAGFAGLLITANLIPATTPTPMAVALPETAPAFTATPTATPTASPTKTSTATATATATVTVTDTRAPTATATATPVPTHTPDPLLALPGAACLPAGSLRQTAEVLQVHDGDTIRVRLAGAGQETTVRYIGIDAPENGEYFDYEATAANSQLVAGRTVTLIKDTSETDAYERLLRYIVVEGTFVNYALVREGLATADDYPPDSACASVLLEAQSKAQSDGRGMWAPTRTPAPQASCDPAYPTVCIPPPPPDLDCPDVRPLRRFQVLPPDPHHFDGDGDGIGCES